MKLLRDPAPARKKVFLYLMTTGKILNGEMDRQGVFYRNGYEPMDIEEFSPCLVSDRIIGPNEAQRIFTSLEDSNA